ncbi:tripartite tricarboxylate transporter substrate binding protein [Xylophilus sp. GOD-11R]|uniref:Bug family tripartite tricarboxylate transporter substrate binding protein n=1 Tax=Xylophilus sp. GOD-11R TaxID=3089814 RepID=UPI00298C4526|nr:tripartite tricarboxylate transporter substrate binding protein [Xylophilus sp. GOD-11R]WPB55914.1 tripartite tricarboxylate transporter substrate binding protein [Xylophilus sp. GOD-11R]
MKASKGTTRTKRRCLLGLAALAAACLLLPSAGVQAAASQGGEQYPAKPIRMVVSSASGGALDIVTRLVSLKLGEYLGQPVVVENRPGADTLVATRYVKDAPADGYTVLAQANGFTILPELNLNPGYDPLADFRGIGMMTRSPQVMVIGGEEPGRNLQEFIARARIEKLSFASGGLGAPPHISALLFLKSQNLDLTNVLYKGTGAAYPDLVAGRVSMMFGGYSGLVPYLQSGKLRPLAVSSTRRIAALRDVPTFVEQGVDYTYTLWLGLVVRSGTPPAVVARLSDALRHALADKSLKERFAAEGADTTFMKPQEFDAYLAREVADMKKLAAEQNMVKQ